MKKLKTYGKFTDYKKFNESLQDILDDGFFYDLEDEGFLVVSHTNKKGVKTGIQSHIKIFKPKVSRNFKASSSFNEMQLFNFEEIKGDVLRFLEMTDIEIKYIYASKKIPGGDNTTEDMLYDPKGETRFYRRDPLLQDGNNKILDDNYDVGDIIQLVIVYGFI